MKNKNIRQYGGNINSDSEFINCYESNLNKIQSAIQKYSGKHTIDIQKAREFIDNQTSPVRREAAKNLIDNTIYITLQEVFDIVGKLIDKVYSQLNNTDTIYLYSGKPEKSFYFLCVIALYHIRQKGLKEPIFIKKLDNDLFLNIKDSPIIILDDVSYSGSQLSDMLNSIYNKCVVQQKMLPPNIYIALIALNENSKYKLSNIVLKSYQEIQSPFKLIYLEDRCYKPIISIIGIEKYFNVLLLFSPWTIGDYTPYVSIYLDHKMADDNSTFTTTLLYGQIPPSSIDITTMYEYISETMGRGVGVLDPREKTKIISQLDDKYKYDDGYVNYTALLNKFISQDKPDNSTTQNEIRFSPFINSCNQNPILLENIRDSEIIHLDYFIFMLSKDCFGIKPKKCVVNNSNHLFLDYLSKKGLYDEDDEILTEDAKMLIPIHTKITRFKCPESWYKKGEFAMTCTNFIGGNKKTKNRKYEKSKLKTKTKKRIKIRK